ncbi:MAG: catalase family peroxidase [Acidobacteriaceae bacterium]|nr:catalase family peroxidase [Acidobacteriaceae bacterium]
MPLPTDEKILKLSNDLIQMFDTLFGAHPGFRPAHAKGIMLSGRFSPTRDAASLSRAPHFSRASTPVTVRFSNSTGLPAIPDNDPNSDPRGMAIRFNLAEHVHTDIVAHSTDGFPTHTGEEFLELLRAVAASSDKSKPHPWPVEEFLGKHPAALAFVQAPKPAPSSFARETYFGVTAMRFISSTGEARYGRYRIIPEAGNDHLDADALKAREPEYLFKEIEERVVRNPIRFKVAVQLANEGDVVDDATVHWPEDRRIVDLGDIDLTGLVPNNAAEQQRIIFDPIPRLDGIEPSADPLLELRAAIYLISGRRRRSAPPTQ